MEAYPDCDFLGELYMELELGNKHGGQFFTPYHLCRAMARVNLTRQLIDEEMDGQGYVSINDCACGAGALLVAAANYLREIGFNYQRNALFVAKDIDSTTALMCYIQLTLLGCAGYVIIGDTLAAPQTGPVLFGEESSRCWYTPVYYEDTWTIRRLAAVEKQRWRAALDATERKAARPEGPRFPKSEAVPEEAALEVPVSMPAMPPTEVNEEPQNAAAPRKRKKKALEGQISITF
jgi:type I restriction-modification system DNA methylase subunit